MLRCVIARLVFLRLGQEAQKGGISICTPTAKGVSIDEYSDSSNEAVEEIECAHGSNADEIEERPLDALIGEGLVQAFVAPVPPAGCRIRLHFAPQLGKVIWRGMEIAYTPHSQVSTLVASTAIPAPAATPANVFLAPGSPWAN